MDTHATFILNLRDQMLADAHEELAHDHPAEYEAVMAK